KQMVKQFDEAGESVIAVETVDRDKTDQYGIVKVDNPDAKLSRIDSIVEKPRPDLAPSNLGVVGRYILSPKIFELLHETGRGAGNEIQLTDAISALLAQESVNAYKFDGIRYDCGSKAGFLEANIEYGLQHPELREQLIEYLDTLGRRLQEEKHSS
ncbi:MAG: sugar phosphate nucleotidyltransferase, partial [Candidatus Sedimenticola sp. (ex Thyasira tokunagai)]